MCTLECRPAAVIKQRHSLARYIDDSICRIATCWPVAATVASVVGCFSGGGGQQGRSVRRSIQRRYDVRAKRHRDCHGRAETCTESRGETRIRHAQTSWQVNCLISPDFTCPFIRLELKHFIPSSSPLYTYNMQVLLLVCNNMAMLAVYIFMTILIICC